MGIKKRSLEEANLGLSRNGANEKKSRKIKLERVKVEEPGKKSLKIGRVSEKKPQIAESKVTKKKAEGSSGKAPKPNESKKVAKLLKKNENRKEARKEQGQFKPENITLSAEEIKERIESIRARKELTKTAKRKIGVLKKKLAIIEGTFVSKAKPESLVVTKSERRHLRRKRSAATRAALLATGAEIKKIPGNPDKVAGVERQKLKKPRKVEETKKLVINKTEPEESEEEEEEEEDDDDDDDDDSDEEIEDSKVGVMDTSEEQSGEDHDDEEEEEEEEEETEEDEDDDDEDDDQEIKYALPANNKVKQKINKIPSIKKEVVERDLEKEQVTNGDGGKKKRFVLFVGNLSFEANGDDVKKHFLTKVSNVLSVRIPTRPGSNSPRGIAYVELSNETDYQKGLSLHNTSINGRRINVEYTQGGSKSVGNRSELVSKNKKLHAMRKSGMLAGKRDGRNDRRQKQKAP